MSLFTACCLLVVLAADPQLDVSTLPRTYSAADSLHIGEEANPDVRECLRELGWEPQPFQAECSAAGASAKHDVTVRFPSPKPSGHVRNDVVVIEGSLAKDASGRPLKARAVVVVHESGSGMTVGRLFAAGLRERGLHAFLVQMPYYGERRGERKRPDATLLSPVMRQAVADVRRARDAIAVLPWVDGEHIALQGTSLGGFVAANVASLDRGYDSTFLMLAGGKLYEMIEKGKREVAQFRQELQQAGIEGEPLRKLLSVVEPTRIAHRLDPQRTWMYSAMLDQVVPFENAQVLASTAGLEGSHHIRMIADHYTGIVYLPLVLGHIAQEVKTAPVRRE